MEKAVPYHRVTTCNSEKTRSVPASFLFWACMSCLSTVQGAGTIHYESDACGEQVHLVVDNAQLSEVLVHMARENAFSVNFSKSLDRTVNGEYRGAIQDVLRKLLNSGNSVLISGDDKRCTVTGTRLNKLQILDGFDGEVIRYTQVEQVDTAEKTASNNPKPEQMRYGEGRKRRPDMTPEERYLDKLERHKWKLERDKRKYGE